MIAHFLKDSLIRRTCVLLVAASIVLGCSLNESVDREKVIGAWKQTREFATGVVIEEIYMFCPDGRYFVFAKRDQSGHVDTYATHGLWAVEDDLIHFTILGSSHPKIPTGYKSENRIVTISETKAVIENVNKEKGTAYRVSAAPETLAVCTTPTP